MLLANQPRSFYCDNRKYAEQTEEIRQEVFGGERKRLCDIKIEFDGTFFVGCLGFNKNLLEANKKSTGFWYNKRQVE